MKSKSAVSILSFLLLFVGIQFSAWAQEEEAAAPEISAMKQTVMSLCDDEYAGRLAGSEGNLKAAAFIESKFKALGLQPLNGAFRQDFKIDAGLQMGQNNKFTINALIERPGLPVDMWRKIPKHWTAGEQWAPLSFSDNGSVSGDVIFAGYGISAPDMNYDDYAGVDVKDKIVLLLTKAPHDKKKTKNIYETLYYNDFGAYTSLEYKAKNAKEHGAKAIIFVSIKGDSADILPELSIEHKNRFSGMICVQATRSAIDELFPKGVSINPIEREINETRKPKSLLLTHRTVELTVDMGNVVKDVPNIYGMITGDTEDEYIVVGAHFDHLGEGGERSNYRSKNPAIHCGADDNASGVALMLALAEYYKANTPEKSIIFVAFNGKETGLHGSEHFVSNLPVPKDKINFMLNLDMVGRMIRERLYVLGTRTSNAVNDYINEIVEEDSSYNIIRAKEAVDPGDQYYFINGGIPALRLFTSLHGDYHRPDDKPDKLNYEGMLKIMNFSVQLLNKIADEDKPDFQRVAAFENMPKEMPMREKAGWLGIIPDFTPMDKGFMIDGTILGGPAHKAGLRDGDIIIKIGSHAVKDYAGLIEAVNHFKPGDETSVTVIRKDSEKTMDLKFPSQSLNVIKN